MEWLSEIFTSVMHFTLHIDKHLLEIITVYQTWTYGIIFLIIFCETGLVIAPFLPGDSLLFALGTFAAKDSIGFWPMSLTVLIAAILGDFVNYNIGKYLSHEVQVKKSLPFVSEKHLAKAQEFFEKHGPKTIVFARFIPILRTFAPFVAGVGKMNYKKFMFYNVFGGFIWTYSFMGLGYFFGNLPFVQENFKLVMVGIIIISIMPPIIEFAHSKIKARAE